MKNGMPMRGERTAKHIAKEKKAATSAGKKTMGPKAGMVPPMFGGKVPVKGKK